MPVKPKAYILPAGPGLEKVCSPACRQLIEDHFDAVWNESGKPYTQEQLSEIIFDAEVLLSSWGVPPITAAMLKKVGRLRYFGYAAGSLKSSVPREIFSYGVKVFSAAPRLAQSVGEYCLAVLMSILRRLPQCSSAVKQGGWWGIAQQHQGHELTGNTIGIVSASSTARAFLRLLRPFQAKILLFDPYLNDEAARQLGVQRASLEEVMRCPIISIHAPSLPSTVNLIHAELIRSIPDGAILINSSRGAVLDEQVLLEELQTGRFLAALDVFQQEPPSPESLFLTLDNVLVTPHIAGSTFECLRALMPEITQDILRSMRNEPTRYEIPERAWDILA